jgi:hypothetical protein
MRNQRRSNPDDPVSAVPVVETALGVGLGLGTGACASVSW